MHEHSCFSRAQHIAPGPAVESRAWVACGREVRLRGLGVGTVFESIGERSSIRPYKAPRRSIVQAN